MSIPLDRLYDHLYNTCDRDIIIYRWIVHGSKKLKDLQYLTDYDQKKSQTTPAAIMHDQEPLDFDFWSLDDYYEFWAEEIKENKIVKNEALIKFVHNLGIRSILKPASNFYDRVLLVHSEQNSDQVIKFQENGFEPVYYWSHALIAADWFRYAQHDPIINYNLDKFSNDFLIYNRAWSGSREYRLKFVDLLLKYKLESSCLTSFSEYDNHIHYTNHQFKNSDLSINIKNIENFLSSNFHCSNASADYNNTDYATSAIEIVLETLFDDTRHHLTEKSLRPIATGKPFLLVATPGSLEYLRSYGFKTFHGLINETYDTIKDPVNRLTAIIQEMKRIQELPHNIKKELWRELHSIAAYNKKHFFSQEFIDTIHHELKQNLDSALQIVDQHKTGYFWTHNNISKLTRTQEEIDIVNQWLDEFLTSPPTTLSIDPSHSTGNSDSLSS